MPLSVGINGTPVIGDSVMLFRQAKGCFYPLAQVVWTKDGVQIFNHMNEGYVGWTNLTDQYDTILQIFFYHN